jgi:hypothetical protein
MTSLGEGTTTTFAPGRSSSSDQLMLLELVLHPQLGGQVLRCTPKADILEGLRAKGSHAVRLDVERYVCDTVINREISTHSSSSTAGGQEGESEEGTTGWGPAVGVTHQGFTEEKRLWKAAQRWTWLHITALQLHRNSGGKNGDGGVLAAVLRESYLTPDLVDFGLITPLPLLIEEGRNGGAKKKTAVEGCGEDHMATTRQQQRGRRSSRNE